VLFNLLPSNHLLPAWARFPTGVILSEAIEDPDLIGIEDSGLAGKNPSVSTLDGNPIHPSSTRHPLASFRMCSKSNRKRVLGKV